MKANELVNTACYRNYIDNKKFWKELIRLLSLHMSFIWTTWT
jgi:hypothetical protein